MPKDSATKMPTSALSTPKFGDKMPYVLLDQLTPDHLSPGTRKSFGAFSPVNTHGNIDANNDAKEKQERRRSKIMDIQRRHLASPVTPASDKRRSLPNNGMTHAQVSEHLSLCIKLSTENKITAKNAFGLHLIDYMSEQLRKKEMSNFQTASTTLAASAKIYAGRVDAIHSETYKMLTGLGRGANNKKGDADGDSGEERDVADDDDAASTTGAATQRKRKQRRKGKTIEQNLKNLNANKIDLEFEVDPLFHKTSQEFDEGGTSGLLLNHMKILDDSYALVLDSNTVVTGLSERYENAQQNSQKHDVQPIIDMYRNADLESAQICPELVDFTFTQWNKDAEDTLAAIRGHDLHHTADNSLVFNMDATVEEIEDVADQPADDGFGDVADDDDGRLNSSDVTERDNATEVGIPVGDTTEARMMESTLQELRIGKASNMVNVLAANPSEYSYFNENQLNTWRGPAHWNFRSRKDPEEEKVKNRAAQKRERKEPYKHRYDVEQNFESHFKQTRKATTLTRSTLDKYSRSMTTLPESLNYDADRLFRTFGRENLLLKRIATGSDDVEDELVGYNYENENDKNNFCPSHALADDDDDDDHMLPEGFEASGADDVTMAPMGLDATSAAPPGFDVTVTASQSQRGEDLCGDNLVSLPNKVAKIDIGYAKTAKKMDMKRLKSSMWSLLLEDKPAKDADPNAGGEPAEAEKQQKSGMKNEHKFSEIYNSLPTKISKNMARNMSVPIAVVSLLHLANEKSLKLTSNDNYSDFTVEQD